MLVSFRFLFLSRLSHYMNTTPIAYTVRRQEDLLR